MVIVYLWVSKVSSMVRVAVLKLMFIIQIKLSFVLNAFIIIVH